MMARNLQFRVILLEAIVERLLVLLCKNKVIDSKEFFDIGDLVFEGQMEPKLTEAAKTASLSRL